jgi:tetratricopeptide (TPR) repeat protein
LGSFDAIIFANRNSILLFTTNNMMPRLEQLYAFLKEQPNEPFLLFAIAKEYENADNLPKALEYYENLQENSPQYVGTYYHLGKLLERLKRPETALEVYKKGADVARAERDFHALSELLAAKANLSDDDDDDDF